MDPGQTESLDEAGLGFFRGPPLAVHSLAKNTVEDQAGPPQPMAAGGPNESQSAASSAPGFPGSIRWRSRGDGTPGLSGFFNAET